MGWKLTSGLHSATSVPWHASFWMRWAPHTDPPGVFEVVCISLRHSLPSICGRVGGGQRLEGSKWAPLYPAGVEAISDDWRRHTHTHRKVPCPQGSALCCAGSGSQALVALSAIRFGLMQVLTNGQNDPPRWVWCCSWLWQCEARIGCSMNGSSGHTSIRGRAISKWVEKGHRRENGTCN